MANGDLQQYAGMCDYDPAKITYFAETDSRNKKISFGIKAKDRTKHIYLIGKTGMGKSTMLENMAVQDIRNGEGMAFIDPHGKSADLLLDYIPEERIKDVVYFAPFDTDYPISFNVMEDVGADKRHLVVSGLMSAFKKIWVDAWSARMEYILNNVLLALLEYPDSTLIGVNRMLADKDYRNKVVQNVTDPSVKSFWTDEFAKYGDRYMQEAGASIQNKIGQFITNPLVRNIIGQPKSTFDIRDIMDSRKIMIINLSKGRVGEMNANLLGSMLVTKIYLGAMSRADVEEVELEKLPQFYLYVDEFQSFANESFANILSEARKYKLSLTIAHQYIEQMSDEVRAAVFGNVGTMVTFRVGAYDAEVLEKEFAPVFTAEDLVNLGFTQIYLKLMIDGVSSAPFSAVTLPGIEKPQESCKLRVIEQSRKTYSKNRNEVEEEIKKWHGTGQKNNQHIKKPETEQKNVEKVEKKDVPHAHVKEQISLDALKKTAERSKPKQPTQENISELKKALSALVGDARRLPAEPIKLVENKKPEQKEEVKKDNKNEIPVPPHTNEPKQSQPERKEVDTQPREIPEDQLKKLLSIDD